MASFELGQITDGFTTLTFRSGDLDSRTTWQLVFEGDDLSVVEVPITDSGSTMSDIHEDQSLESFIRITRLSDEESGVSNGSVVDRRETSSDDSQPGMARIRRELAAMEGPVQDHGSVITSADFESTLLEQSLVRIGQPFAEPPEAAMSNSHPPSLASVAPDPSLVSSLLASPTVNTPDGSVHTVPQDGRGGNATAIILAGPRVADYRLASAGLAPAARADEDGDEPRSRAASFVSSVSVVALILPLDSHAGATEPGQRESAVVGRSPGAGERSPVPLATDPRNGDPGVPQSPAVSLHTISSVSARRSNDEVLRIPGRVVRVHFADERHGPLEGDRTFMSPPPELPPRPPSFPPESYTIPPIPLPPALPGPPTPPSSGDGYSETSDSTHCDTDSTVFPHPPHSLEISGRTGVTSRLTFGQGWLREHLCRCMTGNFVTGVTARSGGHDGGAGGSGWRRLGQTSTATRHSHIV